MTRHHLFDFDVNYNPERRLSQDEHAEHVLGSFRMWLSDARPYMSDELKAECDDALELGKDGFLYTDQTYYVDLISQAYREYESAKR